MVICMLLDAMRQDQKTARTYPGLILPSLMTLEPYKKPWTNMPNMMKPEKPVEMSPFGPASDSRRVPSGNFRPRSV